MKLNKIKNIVSSLAPTLGAAIGGPLGGQAGQILSQVLGVKNSPPDIENAINNLTAEQMVELKKAEKDLIKRENKLLGFIKTQTGMKCDIWAARSIEEIFKGCKIEYPQTEKGNPSFTKSFLENHPSLFLILIVGLFHHS